MSAAVMTVVLAGATAIGLGVPVAIFTSIFASSSSGSVNRSRSLALAAAASSRLPIARGAIFLIVIGPLPVASAAAVRAGPNA